LVILRPAAVASRAIFIGGGGVAFLVGGDISNLLTSGLEKNPGFLEKKFLGFF